MEDSLSYSQLWHQLTPLYEAGEAKAIVRMVMESRFHLSTADLLCYGSSRLTPEEQCELSGMMSRLTEAEPVQYVLGEAVFMDRWFHVERGVLVPRVETEVLCRWIVEETVSPCRILDIGCGSGCIAVSLALENPEAEVTALDISSKALEVTGTNAGRLGARVELRQMDILSPVPWNSRKVDVVVSNPPYVCVSERTAMHPNVLQHEPAEALYVPDADPLLFYRAIADYAQQSLLPGGAIYFECNPLYVEDVGEWLLVNRFTDLSYRDDPFGKKRFVRARFVHPKTSDHEGND